MKEILHLMGLTTKNITIPQILDALAGISIGSSILGQYLDAINVVKINQVIALIATIFGLFWGIHRYMQSRREERRKDRLHRLEVDRLTLEIERLERENKDQAGAA